MYLSMLSLCILYVCIRLLIDVHVLHCIIEHWSILLSLGVAQFHALIQYPDAVAAATAKTVSQQTGFVYQVTLVCIIHRGCARVLHCPNIHHDLYLKTVGYTCEHGICTYNSLPDCIDHQFQPF